MSASLASMVHALSFAPGASRIPDLSKPTPSSVTVFTNGPLNPNPDDATIVKLETIKALGIPIDERPIKRLIPSQFSDNEEGGVTVVLENPDGTFSDVHLGFLADKLSTIPVGQHLIDQLGIETTTQGWATFIKNSPPFGSTNVKGVFVAGDAGTQMTQVTGAMYSGVCAAGGIVHLCIQEEEQIALALYRAKKFAEKKDVVSQGADGGCADDVAALESSA